MRREIDWPSCRLSAINKLRKKNWKVFHKLKLMGNVNGSRRFSHIHTSIHARRMKSTQFHDVWIILYLLYSHFKALMGMKSSKKMSDEFIFKFIAELFCLQLCMRLYIPHSYSELDDKCAQERAEYLWSHSHKHTHTNNIYTCIVHTLYHFINMRWYSIIIYKYCISHKFTNYFLFPRARWSTFFFICKSIGWKLSIYLFSAPVSVYVSSQNVCIIYTSDLSPGIITLNQFYQLR